MSVKKIKIQPSEAADWMAEGFTIECYAVVQPATDPKRGPKGRLKTPRRSVIPKDAVIKLSVEGREPGGGNLGAVWEKVKKELWGRDATLTFTRRQMELCIVKNGGKAAMSSEFLFRYKTVRVLEEFSE